MKPIPIKQVRSAIGVTLLGLTATSIDIEKLKRDWCHVFIVDGMLWVFHKDKGYLIGTGNWTQAEVLFDKSEVTFEECIKRCRELRQVGDKANAQIAHHAV